LFPTSYDRFHIDPNDCFLGEDHEIATKLGSTNFARQYSRNCAKLAIRLFRDKSTEPLIINGSGARGDVLYSNQLDKGNHKSSYIFCLMSMKKASIPILLVLAPKESKCCQLGVEIKAPSRNILSFDRSGRCAMKFAVKVRLVKRYSVSTILRHVSSRSLTRFSVEFRLEESFWKSLWWMAIIFQLYTKSILKMGEKMNYFCSSLGIHSSMSAKRFIDEQEFHTKISLYSIEFTVATCSADELVESIEIKRALEQLKSEYAHFTGGKRN
jgi:hypothetical protein